MKYVELFLTFFKIGLFTFGGGYGMIPLVQQEVVSHGWLDADLLLQYIGICESTPGPIAVNMATFVGSSQAGLAGSLCATLGVVLPSFIVILLIAVALRGFRKNRFVNAAMSGVKPVVAGLITATGVCAALRCLVGAGAPDVRQWVIAALLGAGILVWTRLLKRAFSPIALIGFAAVCGMAVYGAA